MTFPRFSTIIAALNVAGTIRSLRAANEAQTASMIRWRNRTFEALDERDQANQKATRIGRNWQEMYNLLVEDMGNHEDAVAAFMDERDNFKANIALRDELGVELVAAILEAEEALGVKDQIIELATSDVIALQAQLTTATAEVQEQAGEIVETISYVKSCEAALVLVGITIVDIDGEPEVAVDQETFLSAVRLGLIAAPVALAA